ncbi:bacterial Ig-like domain [bacterium BMS3Abin05]|nr:bacterial Ig-like domain [bacterium BMS3Abin05]
MIPKLNRHVILALFGIGAGFLLFSTCSKKLPTPSTTNTPEAEIQLSGYTIDPPVVVVDGGKTNVRVTLVSQKGEPVSGIEVHFSATLGTVTPADTTDSTGTAGAEFTSGNQAGTAEISVRFGHQKTETLPLKIVASLSKSLYMRVSRESILSNGVDSTGISVYLYDSDSKPAKGQAVHFSTTAGYFRSVESQTDSTGKARAVLVGFAGKQDSTAQVQVNAAGNAAQVFVLLKGIRFSLSASPEIIIADGSSTSRIRVLIKESRTNIAIPNARVFFGTDRGTIPNSDNTNASGLCEVDLTSSAKTGQAVVTARYAGMFVDTVRVKFVESTPAFMTLSAKPSVIVADNQSQATIKANISDMNNNPVPDGTPVEFRIVKGSGSVDNRKSTQNGTASSQLTSGTHPDTVFIEVQAGDLKDTIQVRYVVGSVSTVEVRADSASIPADGITATAVRASVYDKAGNPAPDGTTVYFSASLGDITEKGLTQNGVAEVQFSSVVTGAAVIQARVGSVTGETTVQLRPGPPTSILLMFDPSSVGIKDSGRNQTTRIQAIVKDSRNNPAGDGTHVTFSIESGPGGGERLSSTEPVPTVNGMAGVSFLSGIRSGTARIRAEITDASGRSVSPPVRAISTELIIYAGPPFIENVNDRGTSHLSVGIEPINIYGWHVVNNLVKVVAVVGDKYNNPVPEGTAVYFTTTGGIISTYAGYTNSEGVATVTLHTGQPYPTITRFYNTFPDPNAGHPDFSGSDGIIPGPIPDFEDGKVQNSQGGYDENDGIARILAVTEGVDSNGQKSRVWAVTDAVFSGPITHFTLDVSKTTLSPGESAFITIEIYDVNGNPIVSGSTLTAEASAGALSWTSWVTSDPGVTSYRLTFTNNLNPGNPESKPQATPVTIKVKSQNGNVMESTVPIQLNLN